MEKTSSASAVLVTGGAGYIGSHIVRRLADAGETVVVLDDLSNGWAESAGGADLHEADLCDPAALAAVFRRYRIEAVLHLAASTVVPESMIDPAKYYRNNTAGTAMLLHCAAEHEVPHFIFSSTAAVYGVPETGVCREDSPTEPINPYGKSKLLGEAILRDVCSEDRLRGVTGAASAMRHVIFRYFNVAGAQPDATLGQRGHESTHIFKVACEVATGKRKRLDIHGVDYPTADGTCVRDYIHVTDLAAAHQAALRYLRGGGDSTTLNCGYERGFSVREVIRAVERAAGASLPVREAARRAGDPPVLVAAAERIREVLDWSPEFDDLDVIASTALAWERSLGSAQR